jgi:glyoxylase-like metal-dependent hydrolase (beta-lactamase superfamily II)
MKLYHLITGLLRVNAYFLVGDDNQAIVIDCGENYQRVKQTEEKYGFKIKAVLLTHAHFDHAGCAKKLQDDGAEVFISANDCGNGRFLCLFLRHVLPLLFIYIHTIII